MKLEKIAKLLTLGDKHPDTAEGESALKKAQRELDRLGLTREDVFGVEVTLLYPGYEAWQVALLHAVCLRIPCDLIERTEVHKDGNETEAVIRGPSQTVDAVGYLFSTLERAVKEEAFRYGEVMRALCETDEVLKLQLTFQTYAVIGLSERLMVDEEPEEEEPEETHGISKEDASEETEEEPDPLDALLAGLNDLDGKDLPLNLDPSIQGYQAGLRIPLSRAITSGPAARALTMAKEERNAGVPAT